MPLRFPAFNIINLLDILLVAYLIYRLFLLIKDTRAVQLIKGLVILLAAAAISRWLGLYTITWILDNIRTVVLVAIPVVFQPELRRALEQIGRGRFFVRSVANLGEEEVRHLVEQIVKAVTALARTKTGALIIIERKTGLKDYIETGIKIDGMVSSEVLSNVFVPNTPLHDGATIIRGDRLVAAGCFLPLTENYNLNKNLGTRHRAALGISEISDALAIIVSEETGVISFAAEGKLTRFLDDKSLTERLNQLIVPKTTGFSLRNWRLS